MQKTLFENDNLIEPTVGCIYELDGIRFRMTKWRKNRIMTFQQLNPDGSDYIKYYTNLYGLSTLVEDFGIRLIRKRLHEMVRVENFRR